MLQPRPNELSRSAGTGTAAGLQQEVLAAVAAEVDETNVPVAGWGEIQPVAQGVNARLLVMVGEYYQSDIRLGLARA